MDRFCGGSVEVKPSFEESGDMAGRVRGHGIAIRKVATAWPPRLGDEFGLRAMGLAQLHQLLPLVK